MKVLFVLMENRFDQFKDFLDSLELKLILFDDFDNFQDLGIENLFSRYFNAFNCGSNVFELFLKLFDEHFKGLLFFVGNRSCFSPLFTLFVKESDILG